MNCIFFTLPMFLFNMLNVLFSCRYFNLSKIKMPWPLQTLSPRSLIQGERMGDIVCTWVSLPRAAAWKLSPGSKLSSCWAHFLVSEIVFLYCMMLSVSKIIVSCLLFSLLLFYVEGQIQSLLLHLNWKQKSTCCI